MGRPQRLPVLILGMLALAGCSTSSHVITGTPRPPISPESVRIYSAPPAKYEQIATISATSQMSAAITSQQNMDVAISRMKEEAAKLGANGVLLMGVSDQQTGSVGTGVGTTSYGPSSSHGVGLGGSFGLTNKATQGLAIYVPPGFENTPPVPAGAPPAPQSAAPQPPPPIPPPPGYTPPPH